MHFLAAIIENFFESVKKISEILLFLLGFFKISFWMKFWQSVGGGEKFNFLVYELCLVCKPLFSQSTFDSNLFLF